MKTVIVWIKAPCFLQMNTYKEYFKMGNKVILICEEGVSDERIKNCSWEKDLKYEGIELITLHKKAWKKQVNNFLKNYKDSIHIFGSLLPYKPKKICYARKIASQMKLKYGIITEPFINDHKTGIKKYFRRFQLYVLKKYVGIRIIPFSSFYLFISNPYDSFFDYLGIPIERNFPFGYFPQKNVNYDESRSKIIIDENKLNLFFVGGFTKERDLSTVIKAVEKIKEKKYNFRLYMIGQGNTYKEVVELSKKINVYDNIIFLGSLSNNIARTIMKKMDIVVVPKLNASLGIPCLEAIHEGVPSIVSSGDRGGSFFVLKSNSGFVYEKGNSESLSNYIQKIADNDKLKELFIKNAVDFSNKIEPKVIAKYLDEIFNYIFIDNIKEKPIPPWEN